jgi:hypothetical protein
MKELQCKGSVISAWAQMNNGNYGTHPQHLIIHLVGIQIKGKKS